MGLDLFSGVYRLMDKFCALKTKFPHKCRLKNAGLSFSFCAQIRANFGTLNAQQYNELAKTTLPRSGEKSHSLR
jgi:hypothetical protein